MAVTLRLNSFAQGERVAGSDGEGTLLGAPLPALITVLLLRGYGMRCARMKMDPDYSVRT